jgi:hypothetical protein
MALRNRSFVSFVTLATLAVGPSALVACGSKVDPQPAPETRIEGQSEFQSAPPNGAGHGAGRDSADASAGAPNAEGAGTADKGGQAERKVEETDLYRLDGDRLYYLNGYRGLMIFDVSNVDQPKLVGRSPIYGHPVEMIVRGGIANVVVADWYGTMDDGSPFRGSIVRGIDARDPANIKITGEAKLGGWVRDTRVVGDVIYAVSEVYPYWDYGYESGGDGAVASPGGGGSTTKVVVSAVSFAGGKVAATGRYEVPGYGGVFHVTRDSILLAHDVVRDTKQPWSEPTGNTELQYIDISDPAGTIKTRGTITVRGRAYGWGADNGRWNLDFADGKTAHAIGCASVYCGGDAGYVLATADFSNPDAPKVASELAIPSTGWSPTARFTAGRMYLSPNGSYWSGNQGQKTPIQIFDISNPAAPQKAGQAEIEGNVWLFIPSGDKLFALGNEYRQSTGGEYWDSSKISLRYLDVADANAPKVLGTSTFGEGWAWTPAAGTFKAFTKDDSQGLVVLPFSGWSYKHNTYNNGLQLIEFTDTTIKTAGVAKTRGWVERGIFVKGRLVSLSDLALSVVDYTDRANPKVVKELTLARNVIAAEPLGNSIAQVSTDWWGNELDKSELRILPIADAEETKGLDSAVSTVALDGHNARVFRNGDLAYVVTTVREKIDCKTEGGGAKPGAPQSDGAPGGAPSEPTCYGSTQKIQVVDLAGGKATLKGSIKLPLQQYGGWYGYGWGGCMPYDWYHGADVVQVEGDALAFRRWSPVYSYGPEGAKYEESKHSLFVVDLKNADAPKFASTTVTSDLYGWWGNMRVAGSTLYVSHYEWVNRPDPRAPSGERYFVRYYLDPIDLSDRAAPKVGAKINVPGMMVGASDKDPSLVYTIDYRWYADGKTQNDLAVVKIAGSKAYLQGLTTISGWVGNVFVQGEKAITSAQEYNYDGRSTAKIQLHEIDLSNPKAPVDRVAPSRKGWGWLLGVAGDRALVTSGWGSAGLDVYKLQVNAAPVYDQFVRARGWWASSMSRQGDQIFLSSGYWGVQSVTLR